MNNLSWKILLVSTLGLTTLGCYSGGARLYKAGGKVTYNGNPVEGAQVAFAYVDGTSANGVTDKDGNYQLNYLTGIGAKPGACEVIVTKKAVASSTGAAPSTSKDPKDMMNAMSKMMKKQGEVVAPPKDEIPAKYGDPKTSGFKFEIKTTEKDNDFPLPLTD